MGIGQHLLFLLCVAVAGYVQNLTGFALGLILLGLTGLLGVATIADVANVVGVLTLVHAVVLLRRSRPGLNARLLGPTLVASLVGVVAGGLLLQWLSSAWVAALSVLLGATIVACATLLALRGAARSHPSSLGSFVAVGAVSGVLGGLFSTAGPPLAYHLYRQPLPLTTIRDTLVIVFATNALLRLGMMVPTGHVSLQAWWLCVEAVPVVLLQTAWMTRHPSQLKPEQVKRVVCLLLVLIGCGLLAPAVRGLCRWL